MAQRMQIRGLEALQKKMRQLPFNVAHNIGRGATKAAADLYRDHLKAEAPRLIPPNDAVAMQEEIHARRRNSRGRLQARSTVNAGRAGQWSLYEFGTSRQPARPFSRIIWDREKNNLFQRMEDYIRVRLKKAGIIR